MRNPTAGRAGRDVVSLPIHPSILSGYGLIEAPFDLALQRFGTHRRADQSQMRIVGTSASPAQALDFLSVRTFPATRLVLVNLGGWTAVLTNSHNGSDFNDHQFWAGRTVGARTVRVVDQDARWWRRGRLRERLAWEGRIFELHAADNSNIRTVTAMNDGRRWEFIAIGDPLPIEANFNYNAARKKDRFTKENLRDLLVALGPGPLTEDRFLAARQMALLAERITNDEWRQKVERWACSLEDVDDPAFGYYVAGMSYVPFLETHATSVIHSFERAIAINPAYEPTVREHLKRARRIASA